MDYLYPPKLTDKELKKGKEARTNFLQNVTHEKKFIDDVVIKNDTLKPFGSPVIKKIQEMKEIVESSLKWISKNIEVTERQIDEKKTKHNEALDRKNSELEKLTKTAIETLPITQDELNKFPFRYAGINEDFSKKQNKKVLKEKQKKQEEESKTYLDSIKAGVSLVAGFIPFLFILFLAIRAASFEVNSILWKPLPYKILKFVYSLLFFFYYIPYYIFVEIKAMINGYGYPRYEGLFPHNKYDPMDEQKSQTFVSKLFGYADTPALKQWIDSQIKEDQQKKLDALA